MPTLTWMALCLLELQEQHRTPPQFRTAARRYRGAADLTSPSDRDVRAHTGALTAPLRPISVDATRAGGCTLEVLKQRRRAGPLVEEWRSLMAAQADIVAEYLRAIASAEGTHNLRQTSAR
ncbi:hypothetical protein [Hydrogenophaga sp. PML113]|uniref:hypothetical protein n=1 Tax=Hydrogenophaga sp. PML113 TaxID=1899350 RepID=UPI001586933D|nr:hypothetical protein [Hydrogenophaga sp. PML113]